MLLVVGCWLSVVSCLWAVVCFGLLGFAIRLPAEVLGATFPFDGWIVGLLDFWIVDRFAIQI